MLLLGLTSVGLCQTPETDTLQSLLVEVHRLRQEVEAMGPGASGGASQATTPPTRLEGFAPTAGSLVTLGFEDLGGLPGIAVDVRELHDAKRGSARGLIVEVTETPFRRERSFVDADELAGLLNGIDRLVNVASNPTEFKNFEVRYTTRGNLQLTASNSPSGQILYGVSAGRFATAGKLGLSATDMRQLRAVFAAAGEKLTSLPGR
jgi:hypothetical protein